MHLMNSNCKYLIHIRVSCLNNNTKYSIEIILHFRYNLNKKTLPGLSYLTCLNCIKCLHDIVIKSITSVFLPVSVFKD